MKNIRTKWMSVCKGKIVHGMKKQILNYKRGIKLYPTVLLVLAISAFSFNETLAIEKKFSSSDDVYVALGPQSLPGEQIVYLNNPDNIPNDPNDWTLVEASVYNLPWVDGNREEGFRLNLPKPYSGRTAKTRAFSFDYLDYWPECENAGGSFSNAINNYEFVGIVDYQGLESDQITYNNHNSAYYKILLEVPEYAENVKFNFFINADDQAICFMNNKAFTREMNLLNSDDKCYNVSTDLDTAIDCMLAVSCANPFNYADEVCGRENTVVAWPIMDEFYDVLINDVRKVNELVCAVAGDASYDPTGVQFEGSISYDLPPCTELVELNLPDELKEGKDGYPPFDLDEYLIDPENLVNHDEIVWSDDASDWSVTIDDGVVTVTDPDGAQDPVTITFTGSFRWNDDDTCEVSDDVTFVPNSPPVLVPPSLYEICLWPPNNKDEDMDEAKKDGWFVYFNGDKPCDDPKENKCTNIIIDDPNGDEVTVKILSITSDEDVGTKENKQDADIIEYEEGSDEAWLRVQRDGNGDGRVYEIHFCASDGRGGVILDSVQLRVPHDKKDYNNNCDAVDSGQKCDATQLDTPLGCVSPDPTVADLVCEPNDSPDPVTPDDQDEDNDNDGTPDDQDSDNSDDGNGNSVIPAAQNTNNPGNGNNVVAAQDANNPGNDNNVVAAQDANNPGNGNNTVAVVNAQDTDDTEDDSGVNYTPLPLEPDPSPVPVPVYRFFSKAFNAHHFCDETEKNYLINTYPEDIWKLEKVAFYVYRNAEKGTAPVYRLYSESQKTHLFTIDENEKNTLADFSQGVWTYEGVAFYVDSAPADGTVPVYRLYSQDLKTHLFTMDANEKDKLSKKPGWHYEGAAYYVYATSE